MAYNHLRDKVKTFLQPFAESGQAVGAEDVKAYFEKLRGDEEAIRAAAASASEGGSGGDNRREQSGQWSLPTCNCSKLTSLYRFLIRSLSMRIDLYFSVMGASCIPYPTWTVMIRNFMYH